MALNPTGLEFAVNSLQTGLVFAQIHSGAAGDGTDNIAVVGRQLVYWTVPDSGAFGLASPITFVGGPSYGTAYSVTLWDQETDGSMMGEILLTGGDTTFNGDGIYQVTAIDFTLLASDG